MDSILTTTDINNMVNSFVSSETNRLIGPIKTKKSLYQNLSTAYGSLSSKLSALKTLISTFQQTGSDSVFRTKQATSSNTTFIAASAATTAASGSYSLRVSQLAKNDLLVSQELNSSDANGISGTHTFTIKTGDGEGGECVSNVDVTFSGTETNQSVMEKIRDAINSDEATKTSDVKSASSSYTGGTSTIKINVNGTEKRITVNGGGLIAILLMKLCQK